MHANKLLFSPDAVRQRAALLYQSGQLDKAAELYKTLLKRLPKHAALLTDLGTIMLQLGKTEEGVRLLERSLSIQPDQPMACSNCGIGLQNLNRFEAALARYDHAIALNPDLAEAHNNRGFVLHKLMRLDEALLSCERALALNPAYAHALVNQGNVLKDWGRLKQALDSYDRALALLPGLVEAHCNRAIVLKDLHRFEEALAACQRAAALNAHHADAYNIGGLILQDSDRLDEALASFDQALALNPDHADALSNRGVVLAELHRPDEALANCNRAIALQPYHADAYNNRAHALRNLGQVGDALASYRQALQIKPDLAKVHSNLLMTMQYAEDLSPADVFAEHLAFARQFEAPLKGLWRAHENSLAPDRRLKVGYVSADLRQHSVAYFIEPVLARHDRTQVEIFCYYNHFYRDDVTERLAGQAEHWLDCAGLGDEELAQRIRSDGIDILVDLSGHTAHNRLLTFARKPAPLQLSWLGYPATTGLSAMDYRLTDSQAEPIGMTEALNVEALWRLPAFFCYRPRENSTPVIDHPPSEDAGCITFGSFNNFAKVTDAVLQLWAQILNRVPTARLLLEIGGIARPEFRAQTQARLQGLGLPLERVILEPRTGNPALLYQQTDIALDPFPYNGTTTSLETLWMGVPLLTLAGHSCVSRMGVSILTHAGLAELVAETPAAYVDLATQLALEPQRLRDLRHQQRQKMSQSALLDEVGFTRQLEAAYRAMWWAFCAQANAASKEALR